MIQVEVQKLKPIGDTSQKQSTVPQKEQDAGFIQQMIQEQIQKMEKKKEQEQEQEKQKRMYSEDEVQKMIELEVSKIQSPKRDKDN